MSTKKLPPYNFLVSLRKAHSAREIAKMYGCTSSAVQAKLRKGPRNRKRQDRIILPPTRVIKVWRQWGKSQEWIKNKIIELNGGNIEKM